MISLSAAERSAAQLAYTDLMKRLLEKYQVNVAFKLDDEKRAQFFAELKAEWATLKPTIKAKSQSAKSEEGSAKYAPQVKKALKLADKVKAIKEEIKDLKKSLVGTKGKAEVELKLRLAAKMEELGKTNTKVLGLVDAIPEIYWPELKLQRIFSGSSSANGLISLSAAERSAAQLAYTELMKKMLAEYNVNVAFKLEPEVRAKFFAELKERWAALKPTIGKTESAPSAQEPSTPTTSVSKNLSDAQKAYQEFFKKKLKEHGEIYNANISSPAELDDAARADFFSDLKTSWAKEKKKSESNSKAVPKFLVQQMQHTAKEARKEGQTVEINTVLPSIDIDCGNGDEYHFQEHEAERMLAEVPSNVDAEDYLLWSAQSW